MKVSLDIDTYRTKFLGGARQYLFFAFFTFPPDDTTNTLNIAQKMLTPFGYGSASNVFPYLVKSTSIPDSSFEELIIPYPGLPYKMAGSRAFGDWTITFNVDEQGEILKKFNDWQEKIFDVGNNRAGEPDIYMADQQLFLIDNNGESTKKYTLASAWPKSVGQVSLDYASSDIATVDVTFSYQYYFMEDEKVSSSAAKQLMTALLNKFTGSALNIPSGF